MLLELWPSAAHPLMSAPSLVSQWAALWVAVACRCRCCTSDSSAFELLDGCILLRLCGAAPYRQKTLFCPTPLCSVHKVTRDCGWQLLLGEAAGSQKLPQRRPLGLPGGCIVGEVAAALHDVQVRPRHQPVQHLGRHPGHLRTAHHAYNLCQGRKCLHAMRS